MPVVDCPDHPQAALMLEAGTICCGCGRQVVRSDLGLVTRPAPEGLMAELKAEWERNLGVSAFVIEERARALGMLEEAS